VLHIDQGTCKDLAYPGAVLEKPTYALPHALLRALCNKPSLDINIEPLDSRTA
jgi:hypothetical protein